MWLTSDVNLPVELIDAYTKGKLVLFVGAGASVGSPSNLPKFNELAEQVALAHEMTLDARGDDPDAQLGRLQHELGETADVRATVASILTDADSSPNALHETIAKLAHASPKPRVVTTNYDRHLSSAGPPFTQTYQAPAFPLGDNFSGLVYLHGSVDEPSSMLVTDADLGSAYLTRGWAATFLRDMFQKHCVLFIGYSHNDTVMKYLARGHNKTFQDRWALTERGGDDADSDKWKLLGITPITYDNANAHRSLTQVIQSWAEQSEYGWWDHRERIRRLSTWPPQGDPVDDDYLTLTVLQQVELTLYFTEFMTSPEWLTWSLEGGILRRMLTEPDEITIALVAWFSRSFITTDHSDDALRALTTTEPDSSAWPFHLTQAITYRLLQAEDPPNDEQIHTWVALLINSSRTDSRALSHLLVTLAQRGNWQSFLLLFRHLTTAYLEPTVWEHDNSISTRARFPGTAERLNKAWKLASAQLNQEQARDALSLVEEQLQFAHRLQNSKTSDYDDWFLHSVVEPQESIHSMHDVRGALVEVAREALKVFIQDTGLLACWLDRWETSTVPLLRRLAVHGYCERVDIDADKKIRHLIANHWVLDVQLHDEVYRFISIQLPQASRSTQDALVEAAMSAEDDDEYQRFSLMHVVANLGLDLHSATEALIEIRSRHPDYEPREHPERRSWFTIGTHWSPESREVAALLEDLDGGQSSPDDTCRTLLGYADRKGEHGSVWGEVTSALREWASQDGVPSAEILRCLTNTYDRAAPSQHQLDLIDAILEGWSSSPISEENLGSFTDPVLENVSVLRLDPLIRFVARASQTKSTEATHQALRAIAQAASDRLTATTSNQVEHQLVLTESELLVQALIRLLIHEFQEEGDDWAGISSDMSQALNQLLELPDAQGERTASALTAAISVLDALDTTWTSEHVLPLLTNPRITGEPSTAWTGYLLRGRWNEHLLENGLIEFYLDLYAKGHSQLSDDEQQSLARHVADIVVYSATNRKQELLNASAADPDASTGVIEQIAHIWRAAIEGKQELGFAEPWETWAHHYWNHRSKGLPHKLTSDEAAAIAGWVPLVPSASYSEAVELARTSNSGIASHSQQVINDILSQELQHSHPDSTAVLLITLLENATCDPYVCPQLGQITADLATHIHPHQRQPLQNALLNVRCNKAAENLE